MEQWILIAFTLMVQMSAGGFIISALLRSGKKFIHTETDNNKTLFLTLGVLIIATLLSFLHLGNPLRALNTLNNLKTSWLSREILFNTMFLSGLIVYLIIKTILRGGKIINGSVLVITGISAFSLIFCMAEIYMLATVPVWNSIFTPLSFYSSTIGLGSLLVLWGSMLFRKYFNNNKDSEKILINLLDKKKLLILLNATALLAGVISSIVQSGFNSTLIILISRYFSFSVVILSTIIYIYIKTEAKKTENVLLYAVILFSLISEIAGRYIFFHSFSSVGI